MARKKKKSGIKKFGITLGIIVLFLILYVMSALGGLRFFLIHTPSMTGFPIAEKSYLVLLQNNNEIRPGGGFISSYGVVTFKSGVMTDLKINDVYKGIDDHEYVEPPYPHEEMLGGEFYAGYTFRDANHYGDYPQTVDEILKMYKLTNPEAELDGVFAVNFKVVEDVLDIVGEVNVGDLTFTNHNLFELLEYSVHNIDYHNVEEIYTRKSLLQPFAIATIKKVAFSPLKWRLVSNSILRNLEEKHIQLYFTNDNLQGKIANKGWGGAWPETENDFLAVIESNLGGMKSDRYIKRDVTYKVSIEKDPFDGGYSLIGDLQLNLYHFGDYNIPISGLYKGYFRVYFPKGTELLDSTDGVKLINESDDFETFGFITQLSPEERKTLNLKVRLPKNIFDRGKIDYFDGISYKLDLIKQSGTTDDNYSVIVEIPQGLGIKGNGFEQKENFAIFNGPLLRDETLSFEIIPDEIGPRIAFTTFNSLEEIEIHFNESIASTSALDSLNYEIEDTNQANSDITDDVRITSISHEDKVVKIQITGMTEQYEEFYALTIKNINDLHGNSIKESPKKIHLVQRLILAHDEDEIEEDTN